MADMSNSGDVDKMLSDFLTELNEIGDSLHVPPERPAPADAPEATGVSQSVAEARQVPAAARVPVEPISATEPPEPATPGAGHYRNIDVLLMDEAQSTLFKKRAVEEDEFPHNLRIKRRWWLGVIRKPAFFWATGVLLLVAALGAIYVIDPLGTSRSGTVAPSPEAATATASDIVTIPAIPAAEIVPVYPPNARRRGIKGVVQVKADVDEMGKVVRAIAVSGPAELRSPAEQAVGKSRFTPAHRDGVNLKSTVTISVPFPPKDQRTQNNR